MEIISELDPKGSLENLELIVPLFEDLTLEDLTTCVPFKLDELQRAYSEDYIDMDLSYCQEFLVNILKQFKFKNVYCAIEFMLSFFRGIRIGDGVVFTSLIKIFMNVITSREYTIGLFDGGVPIPPSFQYDILTWLLYECVDEEYYEYAGYYNTCDLTEGGVGDLIRTEKNYYGILNPYIGVNKLCRLYKEIGDPLYANKLLQAFDVWQKGIDLDRYSITSDIFEVAELYTDNKMHTGTIYELLQDCSIDECLSSALNFLGHKRKSYSVIEDLLATVVLPKIYKADKVMFHERTIKKLSHMCENEKIPKSIVNLLQVIENKIKGGIIIGY